MADDSTQYTRAKLRWDAFMRLFIKHPGSLARDLHAMMKALPEHADVSLGVVASYLTAANCGMTPAEYQRNLKKGGPKVKPQMQIELPNPDSLHGLIKKLHECMQKRYIRRIEILDTGDVSVEAVENFKV